MKSTQRTIGALVLIAALAVPATAQNNAAQAKKPESLSGTMEASCLLKIVTNPSVISFSDDAIEYLFQSSNVCGRSLTEVLGVADGDYEIRTRVLEQTEIAGPPSERRILMSLNVNLGERMKPAAKELMDALVVNFSNALGAAYQSEMSRMEEQIRLNDREVAYAEAQLKEIQQRLANLSDRDLASSALRSSIGEITAQLRSLQMEKASQEAYREGVAKRISEIQAEVERSLRDDVISGELNEVIQRRVIELENTKQKIQAGVLPSGDLAPVEDKLVTARIDLARRREELGKTGSAAGLGQLTAELSALTLEGNRVRAKEELLERQLAEAKDLLGRSAEYERVMLRLDVAKRNLTEAEIQLSGAMRRSRTLSAPSISVIGG